MRQSNEDQNGEAFRIYADRYPHFLDFAESMSEVESKFESRFYWIVVSQFKVLDELRFGSENYIEAVVDRSST